MTILNKSSDPTSILVIVLTLALFVLSLIEKGFTHEVLLEAAVFLVSVKLIIMARKSSETEIRLEGHLTEINATLNRMASELAGEHERNKPPVTEPGDL